MHALASLWMPILLSAVSVFIISSLIHMVFKWHAPEYRALPNEEAVRAVLRAGNPGPGQYVVPHCADMKEMGSEDMKRKYTEGPVGYINLMANGVPNIGKSLGLWFLLSLAIAAIAAYLATQAIGLDPHRARAAAKLIGAISFLAYGFGSLSDTIWMGKPCSSTSKYLLDSALYGTASGLIFFWLWP